LRNKCRDCCQHWPSCHHACQSAPSDASQESPPSLASGDSPLPSCSLLSRGRTTKAERLSALVVCHARGAMRALPKLCSQPTWR
jgi:hypothetical protein